MTAGAVGGRACRPLYDPRDLDSVPTQDATLATRCNTHMPARDARDTENKKYAN